MGGSLRVEDDVEEPCVLFDVHLVFLDNLAHTSLHERHDYDSFWRYHSHIFVVFIEYYSMRGSKVFILHVQHHQRILLLYVVEALVDVARVKDVQDVVLLQEYAKVLP